MDVETVLTWWHWAIAVYADAFELLYNYLCNNE